MKLKPNQFEARPGLIITELPLLFQTEMVQAILSGRKTQTRRIKGLQAINDPEYFKSVTLMRMDHDIDREYCLKVFRNSDYSNYTKIRSPYGQPGDLLYVREKFTPLPFDMVNQKTALHFSYFSDCDGDSLELAKEYGFKWKPSIHMPKDAARIWLMLEDIRPQRLQDITEQDAIAEGILPIDQHGQLVWKRYDENATVTSSPIVSFWSLWSSINGEDSWQHNPWVWVVKFRVLSTTGRPSIKQILEAHTDITSECKEVSHA